MIEQKKTNPVKKFIRNHKTAILTTALVVTTTAAVLMKKGHEDKDAFLKEHDLYETYYAQED